LEKLSELTDVNIFWVDFADYTWEEQIRLIRTTDLLVGVHGAGLTQLIFLNDNSSVLEVVPSSYSARRHFRALSAYLGHQYYSVMASFVRGEDFVRLDDSFYSTLNDAISDVRSRKCMKNYQYCQSVTRDQPAIINPPW
jgi:protein O-GlcNAc transferase